MWTALICIVRDNQETTLKISEVREQIAEVAPKSGRVDIDFGPSAGGTILDAFVGDIQVRAQLWLLS